MFDGSSWLLTSAASAILANDLSMSATRQIANRIAYAQP
jgi:hypothetical protein